jgi:hypothetical protein
MRSRSLVVVSASLVLTAWAGSADAQIARVFVSVNGNDANVCSNIATPCRTLGGGITQVDANGEVIVIDTGSYAGATITKPVKINVPSGTVAFSGLPVVSNPGAGNTVVIRGLTLKAATPGTGTGLTQTSGKLIVENTVIDGWETGIAINTAEQVAIDHTTIRNCANDGIAVIAAALVAVDNSYLTSNGAFGGGGIHAAAGIVSMDRSEIVGSYVGFWFVGGSGVLRRSLVTGCTYGITSQGVGTNVRLAQNAIIGNVTGVTMGTSGIVTSFGNNEIAGNSFDVTGSMTTAVLQ